MMMNCEVAHPVPKSDSFPCLQSTESRVTYESVENSLRVNDWLNPMSEQGSDWQDGELKVVINHEEQYSIWPVDRKNPAGWRDTGRTGTKAECLEYIRETWTDMRPLGLRQQMDG